MSLIFKLSFLLWEERNVHFLKMKLEKWAIILNVCLHLEIVKAGRHIFIPQMFVFQSENPRSLIISALDTL